MKCLLLITLVLVLAGCGRPEDTSSQHGCLTDDGAAHASVDDEYKAAATDDIREAVFRFQFEENHSSLQQGAGAFFLSVSGNEDPSDEFMERFAGNEPPVKPVSQCEADAGGVVDLETGEHGLVFRVASIRWIRAGLVEVEGGYFEGGLSASGNSYCLELLEGRWIVVRSTMRWIS